MIYSTTSISNSLYFQVVGSDCDQIQGSHITQEEEKEGEYSFNLSSLFKNPPCQNYVLPFLDDSQPSNLISESNVINSFNQSIALGNNHYNDDDSVDVCDHELPCVSVDLLVSHEDFTLDPEYDLVKEDVLVESSSSSHYPL